MLAVEGTYNYLQGWDGDDRLFAYGNDNKLGVCPASSSPPPFTFFSSAGRLRVRRPILVLPGPHSWEQPDYR